MKEYEEATSMRTKATVLEWIQPCCYQERNKVKAKSQEPWTAVSALLSLISTGSW